MDDKQLYRQLLGLTAPWEVESVDLDVEHEEVTVHVAWVGSSNLLEGPECQQMGARHDTREARRWRHLDSCGFTTYLEARVPRMRCAEHGVKTVAVPWSSPHSRFTRAFECFAIKVLQSAQVQRKAAGLLRLSSGQMHDLMARAVMRGLARRAAQETAQIIRHVSLDEKSFRHGHQYVSVLGDTQQCRILEVAEGRSLEAAKALLQQGLTLRQRVQVESVSMDMWGPFMRAQETVLPMADRVHDRFHIAKYLNEAVDKTRREESRRWAAANDAKSPLHQTKYLWLTRPEHLSPAKRALLNAVREHDLETGKVWMHKEAFRDFFEATDLNGAASFFSNWLVTATELGNKFLTKVAYMLEDHRRGLFNYHLHHTSNATAEGLNGLIQGIKANARGYRQFANFRIALLFFLGKLDLNPHTSP